MRPTKRRIVKAHAAEKREAEELPPLVKASDLKWPEAGKHVDRKDEPDLPYSLTYYQIGGESANKDHGWVIATLEIARGRGANADRTYAVQLDGQVCRVGQGPHVLKTVEVHLTSDNIDRLRPHVAIWRKGLADAGRIRDRISTRRAQGQLHRAAGRTSWMW